MFKKCNRDITLNIETARTEYSAVSCITLHSAISVTINIKTFLCSHSCTRSYGKRDKTMNYGFHCYFYSSCVIKVYNHNFCTIMVTSYKEFT